MKGRPFFLSSHSMLSAWTSADDKNPEAGKECGQMKYTFDFSCISQVNTLSALVLPEIPSSPQRG